MLTPPFSHSVFEDASNGPQRWNDTVALNDALPVTVISARSWTSILASAGSFGISNGSLIGLGFSFSSSPLTGVVLVFDVHSPKFSRTKSFRVAVVDVEERVSEATLAKHSLPRPINER